MELYPPSSGLRTPASHRHDGPLKDGPPPVAPAPLPDFIFSTNVAITTAPPCTVYQKLLHTLAGIISAAATIQGKLALHPPQMDELNTKSFGKLDAVTNGEQ